MKKPEDYIKEAEKAAEDAYNFLREATGIKGLEEYFKTVRELRDCIVIFHRGDKEKKVALNLLKKEEEGKSSQLPIMDIYLKDDADSELLMLELELEKLPTILIYKGGKEKCRYVTSPKSKAHGLSG